MQLKIGDKNYNIKFGYKPTLKSKLISKVAKSQANLNKITNDDLEGLEDFLLIIPEMLLVGLQKYHSEEFGYNIDTNEGKEEQLDKVFNLMDDFFDTDGDVRQLFEDLQEEMVANGFLAKMFREEQEKIAENLTEIPKAENVAQIQKTEIPQIPKQD